MTVLVIHGETKYSIVDGLLENILILTLLKSLKGSPRDSEYASYEKCSLHTLATFQSNYQAQNTSEMKYLALAV